MDYRHKYLKYKKKYLNFQYGGGIDEAILIYTINGIIKPQAFPEKTEKEKIEYNELHQNVKDIIEIKDIQGIVTKQVFESNTRYLIDTNNYKIAIITDSKGNVIGNITYDNSKIIKKVFYFYFSNKTILNITLNSFLENDLSLTLGKFPFEIKNN